MVVCSIQHCLIVSNLVSVWTVYLLLCVNFYRLTCQFEEGCAYQYHCHVELCVSILSSQFHCNYKVIYRSSAADTFEGKVWLYIYVLLCSLHSVNMFNVVCRKPDQPTCIHIHTTWLDPDLNNSMHESCLCRKREL